MLKQVHVLNVGFLPSLTEISPTINKRYIAVNIPVYQEILYLNGWTEFREYFLQVWWHLLLFSSLQFKLLPISHIVWHMRGGARNISQNFNWFTRSDLKYHFFSKLLFLVLCIFWHITVFIIVYEVFNFTCNEV